MTQLTSMIERCRSKLRFLASYADLGAGVIDKMSLLRLAWSRFEVYKRNNRPAKKAFSARLAKLNGMSVHFYRDDVQHLAIFDELFLMRAYDLTLVPFIPDIIYDIGAHIGLFSLLAANQWPQCPIIAFEPHPENATWARHNTVGNGVRAAVIEAAASAKSGWMRFNSGGGMGNLDEQGDLTVRVIDLPAMIRSIPSEKTLLKMDIEGEEKLLLAHLLPILPESCVVFVEIHGRSAECASLLSEIHALGFRHLKLSEKRSDDGQYQFIDVFLTRVANEQHP